MTKKQLIEALKYVIVCADKKGGWDNIQKIGKAGSMPAIIFGGGSPFSSDK